MSSKKPLIYLYKYQSNTKPSNPAMELFKRLPVQQVKEMFEMSLGTPATLCANFFVPILAIISFVSVVFLIRELIQVLKDVKTNGKYKIEAITKIEALKPKQNVSQQRLQHLEQQFTELNQLLHQQRKEQEEKKRLESNRYSSLEPRVDESICWIKFRQDQESRNRALSKATEKLINRVTKLEIKYTSAIRDLEKKLKKMDHIVAGNFRIVTKYTEAIRAYHEENEEESKKIADAFFTLQEQVSQELRACKTQINGQEYKLARLQSAYSSYSSITKIRAAPRTKGKKGSKDKQPAIAKEAASLISTSMGAGLIHESL